MDIDLLEKIKRLTIRALVSDDIFMGILVLKGGNALNIAYDISSRGSLDIDFSIQTDFSDQDKKRMKRVANNLLNEEFSKHGLKVFDIEFFEKPNVISEEVVDFWGGYSLRFKIIGTDVFDEYGSDIEKLRKNAIPVAKKNSTKFTVEISKYEYIGNMKPFDIDGATVYVYSPEMIVLEKLRALCQQVPAYKNVVKHMTSKSRARDYYDIHNVFNYFILDFTKTENIALAIEIFAAKKVPLAFVLELEEQRELHRGSWESVIQSIGQDEEILEFDFYFDFVLDKFKFLADC